MKCAQVSLLLAALCLGGCYPQRMPTDGSYQSAHWRAQAEADSRIMGSLFPSDTGLIGNEAVAAILDGDISLKPEGRLGVLPLGWWNAHDAGIGAAHLAILTEKLAPSPSIGEICRIPRILLPDKLSVPAIREVAARLRCETVLIYNVSIKGNYRDHVFAKDTVKTLITIEAAVFHTRTGIIPSSIVVDKAFDLTQDKGENSWELSERAQAEAVATTLAEVGEKILADLDD